MNDGYDISGERKSTTVHAAPGGHSSFSLAHHSNEGMTPRELAIMRKAERQAEADRAYLAATRALANDGMRMAGEGTTVRTAVEHTSSNIFDDPTPSAPPPETDLFKMSAPFAASEDVQQRPSTKVHAAPGGAQTLVLGSDSPSWGNKDNFDKPRHRAQPRSSGQAHPEMKLGSQMAALLGGGAPLHEMNNAPVNHATGTKNSDLIATDAITKDAPPFAVPANGPPDTSNMTHKERIAAMKAYRMSQENGGVAIAAPAVQRQVTAGRDTGVQHTTECSISERPSSRVLAPPGGKSSFSFA